MSRSVRSLSVRSTFAIARLRASCDFSPTFFPLFPPRKLAVTHSANFAREIFFLDATGHLYRSSGADETLYDTPVLFGGDNGLCMKAFVDRLVSAAFQVNRKKEDLIPITNAVWLISDLATITGMEMPVSRARSSFTIGGALRFSLAMGTLTQQGALHSSAC
jgi:hypothetical protein